MRCWIDNSKTLLQLLIASALLNVALAGFFIGHCLLGSPPSREHIMQERINALLNLLPPSAHAEVRDALENENAQVNKIFQEMRQERRIIQNLVGARRLDPQELNDAFSRQRQLFSESQRQYQDAFTKAIADLPYAERHQIKQKMRKRHHGKQSGVSSPSHHASHEAESEPSE